MFRIPRLSTLCLIATVCLSSWLALGRPAPQPQPANAAVAPAKVQPVTKPLSRVKPIAEAQLGERTIGQNPLREQVDDDLPEPNQESWRKLTLRLPKDNGKLLTVELLRSLDWIETEDASEGGAIFLDLVEMGAVGDAEVVAIEPCPPIQPGKGNVITGRFIHEVEQGEVIELRFSNQPEATRVTKNHPYWSVDREDFVPAGNLRDGETVDGLNGTTTVASITMSNYTGLVYNLEIHGQHVYRVGSRGLLAHNTCAGQHHIWPKSWGNGIPYGHPSLPNLSGGPRGWHTRLHRAFSDFLEEKFGRRFMSQAGEKWVKQLGDKDDVKRVMKDFVSWYGKNHPEQAKTFAKQTGLSLRQWFNWQMRVLEEHPEYWAF